VDTVAFGAFRKNLWRELGGYNEGLLTNEDYDFNYRARRLGGQILLDDSGHCDYFARTTLRGLAAQYSRYGAWKAQMLKLHPRSVRWRHLVAPAFFLSLVLLPPLGLLWPPALAACALMLVAYFTLSLVSAFRVSRKEADYRLVPRLCLAFFVIHVMWGGSFVLGLARGVKGPAAARESSAVGPA
jgi:succinoglycan biosynthesis protein ExoA